MKEIKYRCEICRDYKKRPEAFNEMMACYFKNNTKFELRDINAECDTHVCNSCLEQIATQYKSLTTKTT